MPFDKNDVRRAFRDDEFYPLFQPLVELRTGRLVGFEVLARWHHAELGPIQPDAFIPIIQRSGLINTLTQKILKRAFAATPMLPSAIRLSVNLSPYQLLDSTLPGQIGTAADLGGFPLDRLTIEVAESALLENAPRAKEVAHELKAMRCRLSLDDFGTGSSSLNHLQDLPFDELKVDKSFVQAMTESRDRTRIVAAVIGLGKSFGLTTVAEGVETEEQAAGLNWLGCELVQGWLYGRPAAAEEIPRMVAAPPKPCVTIFPEIANAAVHSQIK
jgi:EAL domain-containing protein (putative c-di-GMP-specific phosphodiesterase class I)